MKNITDSTTFDAQSVIMTKTHPTDAKFWPRTYASVVDGVILSTIIFTSMFVIKCLLLNLF